MTQELILVDYQVIGTNETIEGLCRDIALEQTVEVPESLVTPEIESAVVGKIQRIEPDPSQEGAFRATIGYPAHLTGGQIPQFFNLVYGNISLKPGIRLEHIDFPASFVERFPGPKFGIAGIRKRAGVFGRPLLATAIKPKGAGDAHFAEMAYRFALGGGDLIKDDHNLGEEPFEAYRERTLRCRDAVYQANRETGRNTLYLPSVIAPMDRIEAYFEFLTLEQFDGVLLSPGVVGFDMFRRLAATYPLILMAHPTFTGSFLSHRDHGISHGFLLGTLMRLLGADASVFPNYGGRFTFSQQDCHDICDRLREPWHDKAAAFPAPAGGMKFANVESMSREFGADTVFLIGGALISHDADIRVGTQAFADEIRKHFDEVIREPESDLASACELPAVEASSEEPDRLLKFDNYGWSGRQPTHYKQSETLPFQDVSRWELIGKQGEKTAFDLRYFEIAPGGYTSLEKHLHTHTIIGVRGKGILDIQDAPGQPASQTEVAVNDIAYVAPMQVHQLRNERDEPFGFYCIVDHARDKPIPPS